MARTIHIQKPLILFPADTGDLNEPKMVPRGVYKVERVKDPRKPGGRPWLRIAGQRWGNAEACWNAVAVSSSRSGAIFPLWLQLPGLLLALVCSGLLGNGRTTARVNATAAADLTSMKMELTGLMNELGNVTNHYPLLLTGIQKRYQKGYRAAIYSSGVYPRYCTVREARHQAALRVKPDLQDYFVVVNGIDEELYRAWHTWSRADRAAVIAGIEQKRERVLSTGIMAKQQSCYEAMPDTDLADATVANALDFNERVEQEIGDAEPALREVARQNRDCAERAIQLRQRIKVVNEEIARATKPKRSLFNFAKG